MIITHIIGGLGNQMFQYATARAIAENMNETLLLDVSGFSNYQLHNGFELSRVFAGPKKIATKDDLQQVLGWQSNPIINRFLFRNEFSWLRSKQFVIEPHFQYWDGIEKIPSNAYLSGYWQSEKYFKSIDSLIREDFTFKHPMSAANIKIANEIAKGNAISLHIRRGDYVKDATTLATHGICSLEYYHAAVKLISEQVEQPEFFIFSDDIEWVKDNLKIDFPTHFIDHNHGTESYNDMRLMSLCMHNIIANSSFSWWGAWLNQSQNKMVIAPKRWFNNQTNTVSLYPESWLKL